MSEHRLKIWPREYEAIQDGRKPWEFRKNDRNFQIGDTLILECYDPENGYLDVPPIKKTVTYMIHGGLFGIPQDHCIMSIAQRPEMSVDALANFIRTFDGNHDKGAGAIAEAIVAHFSPSDTQIPKNWPKMDIGCMHNGLNDVACDECSPRNAAIFECEAALNPGGEK